MSKPTLALIPSGYKSGKVYSILPNDATGDFDFTRQSIGTRVRKDGLIEEAKTVGSITNLQIRSEEFDNSAWIKSDISVTANDTLAPNGTNTADAIVEGTGTGGKIIYDTYTTSLGVYTFSVHIKKEDKRYTAVQVSGSTTTSMFNVDLDNGTGQVVAGSFDETNIETLANDWYRVSVTFTASSGTLNNQIYLMNGSAYANRNYTGNGTDKNYVWGAMLSEGALSDYIKTEGSQVTERVETFTDVPRLDWYNSNCPSLLLEPQRTNYATNNTSMDTYSNSVFGNNPNPTQTADYTIAPDGTLTATRLQTSKTGTNYSLISFPTTSDDGSGGGYYTASVYVKSNTGSSQTIGFYGANSAPNNRTVTTEWTRIQFTGQRLGNTKYAYLGAINGTDDVIDISVWGAQIELVDSYPSSLIYTEGSTVTRLADECNGSGNADLFNDAEGVLYAEIADFDNDSFRRLTISDGSNDNNISIMFTTTENQIVCFVNDGGSTQASITSYLDTNEFNKIAVKYKENDFSVYINGILKGQDTNCTVPSGLNTLNFDSGTGTADLYGKVKDVRYFDRALTDAELTELTT